MFTVKPLVSGAHQTIGIFAFVADDFENGYFGTPIPGNFGQSGLDPTDIGKIHGKFVNLFSCVMFFLYGRLSLVGGRTDSQIPFLDG